VIVYGQKELPIPSRVIVDGDSGIFYNKKEELILLSHLEQKRKMKSKVDSLEFVNDSLISELDDCEKNLRGSEIDFRKSSNESYNTKTELENQKINIVSLQTQLDSEKRKNKKWKKTVLGTAVLAVGAVGFGVTGLWLPALAVVTVTEIAIIFTNREK
jgi:hypothetical protein